MNLKLAVFASGRGSNFQAILDAIDDGRLRAEVVLLLSDRDDAGALEIAKQAGIATQIINPRSFAEADEYTQALLRILEQSECDLIVLAGYLKKIPAPVIQKFANRIINIHPALLPSFGGKGMYGLRVHQAVLDYGCKVSGATVHFVDRDYDTGAPILQRCAPVRDDDTAETLAARVLEIEHELLPEALQLFAEGRMPSHRKTLIEE